MLFKEIAQIFSVITIGALLFSGCGTSEEGLSFETGIFIDSDVVNIAYKTATQRGVTTSKGEFKYMEGETIVFSVGDIQFPEVKTKSVITPLDLAKTSDINDTQAVNIARFLQSLDSDLNTDGIQIAAKAHEKAKELQIENVDFSETVEFESSISQLIADSGSPIKELVSKADAIQHMENTFTNFTKRKGLFFEPMLIGKTYYNAYYDEAINNKWVVSSIAFHKDNKTTYEQDGIVTYGTYSMVSRHLELVKDEKTYFVQAFLFDTQLDALTTCWIESTAKEVLCAGLTIEYLFSDEQKALSFINSQNN